MKKRVLCHVLIAVFTLALTLPVFAKSEYSVKKTDTAPKIDGKCDEPSWTAASSLEISPDVCASDGWVYDDDNTDSAYAEVKMLWVDGENDSGIYIYAEVADETQCVPANKNTSDYSSPLDDRLVFLVEPMNQKRSSDKNTALRFSFIPYVGEDIEVDTAAGCRWYESNYNKRGGESEKNIKIASSLKTERKETGESIVGYTLEVYISTDMLSTAIGDFELKENHEMGFGFILYDYTYDAEAYGSGTPAESCKFPVNIVSDVKGGSLSTVGTVPRQYNVLKLENDVKEAEKQYTLEEIDDAPLAQAVLLLKDLDTSLYTKATKAVFDTAFLKAQAFLLVQTDSEEDMKKAEELKKTLIAAYRGLELTEEGAAVISKEARQKLSAAITELRAFIGQNSGINSEDAKTLLNEAEGLYAKDGAEYVELVRMCTRIQSFIDENRLAENAGYKKSSDDGFGVAETVFTVLFILTAVATVIFIVILKRKKEIDSRVSDEFNTATGNFDYDYEISEKKSLFGIFKEFFGGKDTVYSDDFEEEDSDDDEYDYDKYD